GEVSQYSSETDDSESGTEIRPDAPSQPVRTAAPAPSSVESEGALASDEALQALREKLTGG
ncbi:MAG TPA: 30S ribosomal protein S1, partial [Nocardioidaceae bacterium]|nr:30S ribosomal protein S1 [Nocardioidaceae bacterium]